MLTAPTVPEGECSGRDGGAAPCADKNRNDRLPKWKEQEHEEGQRVFDLQVISLGKPGVDG